MCVGVYMCMYACVHEQDLIPDLSPEFPESQSLERPKDLNSARRLGWLFCTLQCAAVGLCMGHNEISQVRRHLRSSFFLRKWVTMSAKPIFHLSFIMGHWIPRRCIIASRLETHMSMYMHRVCSSQCRQHHMSHFLGIFCDLYLYPT